MSYSTGRLSLSPTGSQTFVVGFQPTWARFVVAGKPSDTVSHMSFGSTDGTHQNTQSTFADTTGAASFSTNTKVVSHYERVSGTITESLAASWTGFTATGVTLNVTTANSNYSVTMECGN